MVDYNNSDWIKRNIVATPGSVSNEGWLQRALYNVPGGVSNTPQSMLRQITGNAGSQTSSFGAKPALTSKGMTDAQRNAMISDKRNTGGATTPGAASNPILDLLRQMYKQAGQSSGANLSGYNASLKMLAKERKRVKARYKKYSGQIADIYGTLTGITQGMIANIAPAGESMRADLSAQEAASAEATRSTEDARLSTANEARSALGLEALAGEYAAGDAVTAQTEGMIADSAANKTASENTLLANEAIATSQGQNQIVGYGLQQEESVKQLQRSLEDALAAIRAERANVLTQRSQAASSGSGPNLGAQISILEQIQAIENGQPATDPVGIFLQNNSSLAPVAAPLVNTFADWVTSNYTDLFNASGSKKADPIIAIERFKASSPQAAASLSQSPLLAVLLSQYYNSIANPN
jgi:hypothetical protein